MDDLSRRRDGRGKPWCAVCRKYVERVEETPVRASLNNREGEQVLLRVACHGKFQAMVLNHDDLKKLGANGATYGIAFEAEAKALLEEGKIPPLPVAPNELAAYDVEGVELPEDEPPR